jgi:hypothetical protein
LKNLIEPAVVYLQSPAADLIPILIPSLDMQPRSQKDVLHDLEQAKIKVVILNERLINLPAPLINYLRAQYVHYWASVYLYAPTVYATMQTFTLKFSGRYQIDTKLPNVIQIDGRSMQNSQQLDVHTTSAKQAYRLKLVPDNASLHKDSRFYADSAEGFAKPTVF